MEKRRVYYFDNMRLIAISLMMLVHLAGQNFYYYKPGQWEWGVLNIYNASGRWTIQIFIMISGALFLGGSQSIETIWKKNIGRIIGAFFAWSFLYAVFYFAGGAALDRTIMDFFTGHFHLWFLPMIAGLYMLIPFLRRIVEDKKLTEYFLILSFVFSILIPQTVFIAGLFSENISGIIDLTFAGVSFHFGFGYVFYFVLGYYLHSLDINDKWKKICYISGILGFVMTVALTRLLDYTANGADTSFYGVFTINCLMMSIGAFVFGKYKLDRKPENVKLAMLINKLSKYSFGAYLVHALVFEQLNNRLGINTLCFNPIFSVPLITLLVLVISFMISWICNYIPGIRKLV